LLILLWLGAGFVLGFVYVMYARSARAGVKTVFGVGLLVAALIYLLFLYRAPDPLQWTLVEAAGVAGFGLAGWFGIRGSAWWLVAGWGVHPVWDIGLHYVGPGQYAPAWYTVPCVSFDLLVAAYVAVALTGSVAHGGGRQQ
jgi:hypothetical protein